MTMALRLYSKGEAQRLTDDIKSAAVAARRGLDRLASLVEEASKGNVWQILGYASWTAYLSATLGEMPLRLDKAERQEVVAMLSEQGLSTRAIAPIVGVSHMTVSNDLAPSGVQTFTPDPDVETALAVIEDDIVVAEMVYETSAPRPVVGMDGKTYTQPATPRQAPRSPLIDEARSAGFQLRKAIERIERIKSDDRFTRNKVEILAALQPHLDFANETISGL
jgi:hypothetical protein